VLPPDRAEVRAFLNRELADEDAQASREAFCRAAADAFEQAGLVLFLGGWVQRDDSVAGLARVAQIGGELAQGSLALLGAGRVYAAMALHRQLVEVEYLLWTFADDADAGARWLRASPAQLDRHFSPSAMRKRAGDRFRHSEYRTHCRLGGHPNPQAAHHLPGRDRDAVMGARMQWLDLGLHLDRGWGFMLDAAKAQHWLDAIPPVPLAVVAKARDEWRERDAATRHALSALLPLIDADEGASVS
jgi:hypothetical protein